MAFPTNKSDFIPAMTEIAREAGALLMEYFHQRVKVEYKGDVDLVTIADRKSEALIRERIRARWPSHDILGEEGGLVDNNSDYRWYVDPLDGTTNFAHGFPVFCVSLGLEYKERLIAGVVFVGEARGNVRDFSGGAFQLNSRETVASNGLIHAALLAEFGAIFEGRGLEELPNPAEYARTRGK